ncbi:MAG TPA: ATP-binding protein [Ferruginibacter sp.]|jgi:AAA15 family ATPase/GTPase|nr:ATP-binding protein [Ferruginibacter sp.]
MLLKFYCSNFKSIKDEIEFNMFSGSYKRHESHLVKYKDKEVLRAAAIYGTNGSGKTNVLLAIQFLHKLITVGTRDINEKLNIPIFKLSDCRNLPTKFEIDFLAESKRYNYSLEILNDIIVREDLLQISEQSEIIVFKRKYTGKKTSLTIAPNRNKDQKEKLREEIYSDELRENQTFLKESVNKKIPETQIPYDWFYNKLKFISVGALISNPIQTIENPRFSLAYTFMTDQDFFESSKKLIQEAKVGISDIKLVKYSVEELKTKGIIIHPVLIDNMLTNPNKKEYAGMFQGGDLYTGYVENNEVKFVKISTIHKNSKGEEVEFKFSEESQGIQRLFELLPAIYRSINKGEIFIIDEIESSFHPVLIKEILYLYLKTIPEDAGQLIFTTHESYLLDLHLFRQDEIWFCEKDKDGGTKLYSLSEFRPRFDKDIRKGYFEGQFGGRIPFLADLNKLEDEE